MGEQATAARPYDAPRPAEYRDIPPAIRRGDVRGQLLPPGPPAFLSDVLTVTFAANTPKFLLNMHRTHGDVCSFFLARQLFIGVFSAQGAYEVTVSKQHHFVKGVGFARMRKVLGEGLLTNEEPTHLQHRRMMQPPFHHGNLDGYVARMHHIIDTYLDTWGEDIALSNEMMALTLEIVSQCLFGTDSRKYTARIAHAMEIAIDRIERTMLPGLDRFDSSPLPYFAAFRQASEELVDIAEEIMAERMAAGADRTDDLLGILLSMRDRISMEHIRDEVLTLILSGHETTANVLTWAFAHLARTPEWQQQLQTEASGIDLATPMSYADLEAATPVATAILSEALRLAPPVWVAPRIAVDDVVIDGVPIPKGAHVLVSQYVTQRDPRYFEDPESFNPGRWVDQEFERSLPKGAYFPFGAGTRKCLGEYFALAESRLILLFVGQRFKLDADIPKASPRATYRPKGRVPTRVTRMAPK